MNKFTIDLETCRTKSDVFSQLLGHINAPNWHGKNLDALWESVAYTANGTLVPPYQISFTNLKSASAELTDLASQISQLFADAKAEEKVEVTCNFLIE